VRHSQINKKIENFLMRQRMVDVKKQTKVMTGGVVQTGKDNPAVVSIGADDVARIAAAEGLPIYQPDQINYNGKRYILKEPLLCEVSWEWNAFFIRYKPFRIVATATTWLETVEEFSFEFADTYEGFNEEGMEGLGHLYQEVLRLMNEMVIKVE
jgi:hypothetical protein